MPDLPVTKTPLWQTIAATLRADLGAGHYRAGDKLPTEAALAGRFGVNRHTVRQAIAALAEDGVVHSRRGAGVFVTAPPTEYPIGRRVRFHQNLLAAGQIPEKQVLALDTRRADAGEAAALGLSEGAMVHVYDGLSLAGGQPIALFRSVFPAARLPGLPDALRADGSVTRALSECGVPDYLRATTRLTARLADAVQAAHLRLREAAPILQSSAVNVTPEGDPVEFGLTWFAGDRVTLTLSAQDL